MPSAGAEVAERAERTGTETTWDKSKDEYVQYDPSFHISFILGGNLDANRGLMDVL